MSKDIIKAYKWVSEDLRSAWISYLCNTVCGDIASPQGMRDFDIQYEIGKWTEQPKPEHPLFCFKDEGYAREWKTQLTVYNGTDGWVLFQAEVEPIEHNHRYWFFECGSLFWFKLFLGDRSGIYSKKYIENNFLGSDKKQRGMPEGTVACSRVRLIEQLSS